MPKTTPENTTIDITHNWAIGRQLTPFEKLENFLAGYVGKLRGEIGEKTLTFKKQ